MGSPLISVLIADFDSDSARLVETLRSVRKQKYSNVEIIVLSLENTFDNIDDFSVRYKKISDIDEVKVREAGMDMSRGKYYVYMESGGVLQSAEIEDSIEILENEDIPSFAYKMKEFGVISRQKNIFEDSGQRFVRLLQSNAVRSAHEGSLSENIDSIVEFTRNFQIDRPYQRKQNTLQDLRQSKAWRVTYPLRRAAQLNTVKVCIKLLKASYWAVRHPKRIVSYIRSIQQERAARKKYQCAWIITDRPDEASDNGILFYEYLARVHPEINAYYVISRKSSDFDRLKSEGVRTVDHGSKEHEKLVRYADVEMSAFFNFAPFDLSQLGREKPLKRVFILHGMDQSDLSLHYSRLGMDMYCVVTQESYDFYKSSKSIVDIRDRNIQLTGMVRYDLIRKMSSQIEKSERRKIVIAPTWRRFLLYKPGTTEKVPEGTLPKSKYCQYYTELFNSVELKELSQRYEIVLIPHPEMLHRIDEFSVPEFITVKTYKELGTKKLYEIALGTKLFISDFSSTTFDFAFLGANVAYFNFDEEDYYSEKQDLYRSWFSIDKDGFGPSIKAIDGLKKYLKSGRWVRREENITKVWSQIPENASETLYKKISELLEDK